MQKRVIRERLPGEKNAKKGKKGKITRRKNAKRGILP